MVSDVIAGRYQLLEQVGEGGAAQVYRAMDTRLGRVVAIKLLRESYSNDASFTLRFRNEARAAARLHHPNIVDVYDYDEADGRYFIAMEYVPGENLKSYFNDRAPLSEDAARDIAADVLEGLGAAHAAGLVHRDMKPQNVLMSPNGELKIADFGIAKAMGDAGMTEAGIAFGTPHYLSPEQARGDDVTPRSDLYAVGVMLYEALSGRLPFDGENPMRVAYAHIFEAPPPFGELAPNLSHEMVAFVERAMAKDPEDRFIDAGDMLAALEELPPAPAGGLVPSKAAASEPTVAIPVASRPEPAPLVARTPARPVAATPPPVAARTVAYGQPAAPVERSRRAGPLWALVPALLILLFGCIALAATGNLNGLLGLGAAAPPPLATETPIVAVVAETPTAPPARNTAVPTPRPSDTPAPTPTPLPTDVPATAVPTSAPTPRPLPPTEPSGLVASLDEGPSVLLTWSDTSGNETGFVLQRSTDGGRYATLARLSPGVEEYRDKLVTPGRTYAYRIKAVRDGLSSGFDSDQVTIPEPTPVPVVPTAVPTPIPPAPEPTEEPTEAPAPAPAATATVSLEHSDFAGGLRDNDGYKGRDVIVLYGQGSGFEEMTASFQIDGEPSDDGQASITFTGFDDEAPGKNVVRIEVNGETVWDDRPSRFEDDFASQTRANWNDWSVTFNASLLEEGGNELRLVNLEPNGDVRRPPFIIVDEAVVTYPTP